MIIINCDIGECGPDHPVDVALMGHIDASGCVDAIVENPDGSTRIQTVPIAADTVCIHSDSDIALELAEKLAALCREKDAG